MPPPYISVIVLWIILACSGCSSLVTDKNARSAGLQSYLNQTTPLIFFYPSPIHVDEQLKVFGIGGVIHELVQYFDIHESTRGLIEQFITSTASKDGFSPLIVDPGNWDTLKENEDRLVLFFYVDWRLSYRRLPPDLKRYRLQAGVVSKIIPLSQVLSKKGTIALRTAVWEGRCLFDAMEGRYYTADEWMEGKAKRVEKSVNSMQQSCGQVLAEQFTQMDVQR